jgi:hypothetical protein
MFPRNDFHWRFYYADRNLKSIFTGGLQLPACKNDDFYWPLALAVMKNATKNRFTIANIKLFCTSVDRGPTFASTPPRTTVDSKLQFLENTKILLRSF